MSESTSHQGSHAWRPVIVSLILMAIIAGCGPSAGVGTGGTGSFLSGKVADGYLVNASVFLDKNGNYLLDPGEPSATTDANGAYRLDVDPADVGRYPIVALAIKGVTIDRDTSQAVASSFLFSIPKENVSGQLSNNFISPISSLLREMMETGKYTTMQQAMETLATKMGLPAGTDVMADYMAAGNTAMHTAAQNMTTLMGNQMGQIFGSSSPTASVSTTVDVNRYRDMMGTIFSNMSSVMGSNGQAGISNLNDTMTTAVSNMHPSSVGQPFRNMSAAFRNRKLK